MNVTVTNPTAVSWLRVSPTGTAPPLASNLNFSAGQTIANLVVVGLGSGGEVDITNLSGRTDVIADVVGYYTPGAGSDFVPVSPTRLLDSRTGAGGYTSPWGQQQTRSVGVGGSAVVPAGATAAAINVTVTNPSAPSWLRVSPAGAPPPLASNLNFDRGDTIANLVMVALGAGGRVDVTNLNGHTDVIADVVGYFTDST